MFWTNISYFQVLLKTYTKPCTNNYVISCAGPILESKGMHAIFKKTGKKKFFKMAKYLEIWAKMYNIWKYFEKGLVIACDYRTQ